VVLACRVAKVVLTQREMDAKDLAESITMIYSEVGKDRPVLLTAVARPASR
jgi:hypothetical protein